MGYGDCPWSLATSQGRSKARIGGLTEALHAQPLGEWEVQPPLLMAMNGPYIGHQLDACYSTQYTTPVLLD